MNAKRERKTGIAPPMMKTLRHPKRGSTTATRGPHTPTPAAEPTDARVTAVARKCCGTISKIDEAITGNKPPNASPVRSLMAINSAPVWTKIVQKDPIEKDNAARSKADLRAIKSASVPNNTAPNAVPT